MDTGAAAASSIRPRGIAALAVPLALLLFSRKPDSLLRAELWGDEGWSFYPDAYAHGLRCLLIPAGGYLDTLQRLVALLAQPLPLSAVPTLFAAAAFLVQLLPALFLLSGRMAAALPPPALRLALALLTIAVPNGFELFVNLTNAQWNLAILALLVVVGSPPRLRTGRWFDLAVLALSGLSGPFALMLAPVALWQALRWGRNRDGWMRLAAVLLTALIQLAVLALAANGTRSHAPLGAGPRMLAQVLSAQVLLTAEIGWRSVGAVQNWASWHDNLLPVGVLLGGLAVAALGLGRAAVPLRQCALFVGLMLGASLLSPQVSVSAPRWEVMTHIPMGNRYFVLPVLLWIALLVSLAADRAPLPRTIGILLLLPVLLWSVPREWAVLRLPHTDFIRRARLFEASPPGTVMRFPIVPPGLTPMQLTKRAG